MQFRNAGGTEDELLQNRFTAYLMLAIKRKKADYREAWVRRTAREKIEEPKTVFKLSDRGGQRAESLIEWLIVRELLEKALCGLRKEERRIVVEHLLYEWSFTDIADKHGMHYKAVAAVYYRALDKIRKELEQTDELL